MNLSINPKYFINAGVWEENRTILDAIDLVTGDLREGEYYDRAADIGGNP